MPSISTLLLFPAAISALTFDCSHVRVGGQSFNLEKLGGPKEVHYQESNDLYISNTTFTIDICAPLKRDTDSEKAKFQCPSGTRVCGVERQYQGDKDPLVDKVIPIAGDFTTSHGSSRALDPKFERLKGSDSSADSDKEGLRGKLHGGEFKNKKQKAIVEFLCDEKLEGTEGFESTEKRSMTDSNSYASMGKREAEDEGDGDDKEKDPLPDLDAGKSLSFVSYKEEEDVGVLRLTWKTKYACEGAADKKPGGKKTAGWGFFTWFLIIVFLLVAAYIIFGSWLNYNRYGARGWDLIPHGDSIRDLPYIVKDVGGNIVDRLKGSGSSRGGYSAV
ncbi:autophagy-related protein 27 [Zymoseptoria brevis]|uniref:Autophagy-related protein 27 n=1 Tax=Zymoseptoria brevis TaxID=1047168 RepID=A0A0F4GKZ3_9PEZI|nr:autophagy-related protein 27 [Zymoseptoria brevis]